MLRVEFHCHSIYSEDSLMEPASLLKACIRKGIDRVVITDHNTIRGALEAKRLDPERVIIGEEIMTTEGELLAAFVAEEVPALLKPLEAVKRLRAQGAFISVSHPFDRGRSSWSEETLRSLLGYLDAIEVFNARTILPGYNRQALLFAQANNLAATYGSDAHTLVELGRASFIVQSFSDAEGLRKVIQNAECQPKLSGAWVHLWSHWAKWSKKNGFVSRK